MTSEAQVQANRINAQLSTGPKDSSETCFNAMTHGLLSKELYIKRESINENPNEYRQLLQFLLDDIKPTSVIEAMLIERIAVAYWRLRRVLAVENDVVINRSRGWGMKAILDDEKTTDKVLNFGMDWMDKFTRYETMLERQLYRAINQLEQMRQKPLQTKLLNLEQR